MSECFGISRIEDTGDCPQYSPCGTTFLREWLHGTLRRVSLSRRQVSVGRWGSSIVTLRMKTKKHFVPGGKKSFVFLNGSMLCARSLR